MTDAIIAVENLGKKYRLRHRANGRYVALRDVVTQKLKAPFHFFKNHNLNGEYGRSTAEDFWALQDVSFEVGRGEVVGVIGRNGAGKSTLLKILSRITEPTAGRVRLHGRVGSLLEVGTGFHPELTGRENIFLNGAVLGMTKAEIRGKFDEIVAFAEVEKFLDTPVKHYSSGMYVRLAFSVAAHLQPDILIVDEVLAVGDAAFQAKCLGKMQDASRHQGRTVLFVSHNMAIVNKLCRRAMLLSKGKLAQIGDTSEIVDAYLGAGAASAASVTVRPQDHLESWGGSNSIQLMSVTLVNPEFETFKVRWQQPIKLELAFCVKKELPVAIFSLAVTNSDGIEIFGSHSSHESPYSLKPGPCRIQVELKNPLRAGLYYLTCGADYPIASVSIFHAPRIATLEVLDVGLDGRHQPQWGNTVIDVEAEWHSLTQVPL